MVLFSEIKPKKKVRAKPSPLDLTANNTKTF